MKNSNAKKLLVIASVVFVLCAMFCIGVSAADDHTCVYTNYVYNNDATCTQNGTKTAYCDICNLTYDTIADPDHPATGHTPETLEAVAATCYSTGLTEGKKCSVCGIIIEAQQTIPMTDHTYSTEYYTVVEPTCYSTGAKAHKCTVCGDFELDNQEIIPMVAHNYKWTVTKEATCAAEGSKTGVCTVCKDTVTEVIPTTDHVYGDWYVTVEATCHSKGEEEKVCKNCNAHKTRETDMIAHTPSVIPAVEPTCTEPGRTAETICYVCKEVLVPHEYIAPLGHDFYVVDDISVPTCTSKGKGHTYCTRCDYSVITEIPMIDHVDANGDGICDECSYDMKVQTCGCFCHYDTFIAKIVRVFNTILSNILNKEFKCCDDMEPLESIFA